MGDRVLGIGIVGAGFMGRTYAEVTAHYSRRARLVCVAGGRRAPQLAGDYAVPCESTVGALMARPDVEAVILASPESAHLEQTRAAAAAGKHVLTEKPMAPDVAGCQRMIDAAATAGVVLMCVQHQRFRPAHRLARTLIEEGRIGRVQQLRLVSTGTLQGSAGMTAERPWYADPDGGLFLSQCVHNFDLMRWLAGDEPKRVYARVRSFGTHGLPNLSVSALVEFANGVLGELWVNLELPGVTFPGTQFRAQVIGEQALLDVDGYVGLDLGADGRWTRLYEQPAFNTLNPLDPVRLEAYVAQNQAFIDAILDGGQPPVAGADGRAAVGLCQAALQSSRSGQAVDLPL